MAGLSRDPVSHVTPNLHEKRGGEPENPKRPHMTVGDDGGGSDSDSDSDSDSEARSPANVNEPIDVPSGAAAG